MTTFILRESRGIIERIEANKNRQQININLINGTLRGVQEGMLRHNTHTTAA